ncbi:hypothetical protein C9374_011487 [Naegleria lovaniensis]|uniref:Uncharacterized protein n=1 Tax=Naegleria lovaniensis TaxID=51637 RepID=A0AA88H496_NAELO|nr:uncharacterized protein C9374_011487 [Naegleria lovaniensis]KAG2392762.1 hypothetical protein C9374_011487 [Naegleria lovaniensis]
MNTFSPHQQDVVVDHHQLASPSFIRIVESIVQQLFDQVSDCFGPNANARAKIIVDLSSSAHKQAKYVSSEGSFILQHLSVRHPVGVMIMKALKQLHVGCGDGTISFLKILLELTRGVHELVMNSVEPLVIGEVLMKIEKFCVNEMKKFGFNLLVNEKNEQIDLSSIKNNKDILSLKIRLHSEKARELLKTFLSTKLNDKETQLFMDVCTEASSTLYENLTIHEMKNLQQNPNFHNIHVIALTSLSGKAEYFKGLAFEHGLQHPYMLRQHENCKIIVLSDIPLELIKEKKKNEFRTAEERLQLLRNERAKIDQQINHIIKSGVGVVVSNDAIDDISLDRFCKSGIIALRHVRQDICDKLCELTSSTKVYSCEQEIKEEYLGSVSTIKIHEDHRQTESTVYIQGKTESRIGTIIVHAANVIIQHRYIRIIKGALKILRNSYEDCLIAPGGGCLEMMLGYRIREMCCSTNTKLTPTEQCIYEMFANALESSIPATLCEKSGFNVNLVMRQWKLLTQQSLSTTKNTFTTTQLHTLNCLKYPVEFVEPVQLGIWDSMRVKIQSLHQAIELTCSLIKINSILTSPDLKKESQDKLNQTLNQLMMEQQEASNTTKNDQWKYQRYHSGLNSGGKLDPKKKQDIIKREERFYSKEMTKHRRMLEMNQLIMEPGSNTAHTREQELEFHARKEHERKLREKGLLGYDLEPFQ